MSHAAIDNLLAATHEVFAEKGELSDCTRSSRRQTRERRRSRACATRRRPRTPRARRTTWSPARRGSGRAADCDRFPSTCSSSMRPVSWRSPTPSPRPTRAKNLILLGDPLQLSQVAKAEHPDGSGASVLEHILGEHATMPDDQGVFISETRRMHPDVCRFISNQIYEGRLSSHESCAQQDTQFGTGLRWLEAHARRSFDRVAGGGRRSSSHRSRRCSGPRGSINGASRRRCGPRTSWSSRPTTTRSTCCARPSTEPRTCATSRSALWTSFRAARRRSSFSR